MIVRLDMADPLKMLKARMAGRSLRSVAREIPCSAAYLSDIMLGKRTPGPRVLDYLGLKREVDKSVTYRYRRRG